MCQDSEMKERQQQQWLRCEWALNQNIENHADICSVLYRQRRLCDQTWHSDICHLYWSSERLNLRRNVKECYSCRADSLDSKWNMKRGCVTKKSQHCDQQIDL